MAYIALYRKWRPHTFRDLVGQDHISHTLSQAITSGRIGHAYLFSGPRGTGKTSTAKILAMALNCKEGPTPDPCGQCESCQRIMDGSAMDVFEIDAASNRGIDEIRGLRETVKFAPAEGRYKVYIIDEVHMLTAEAFNALLKTLEEPPAHVVFILATTEAHKVPPTIQSRCQRFDFRRITVGEIQGRLRYICDEMKTEADDKALELIALQADGGLRDALSILDQCISLSDGRVTEAQVQEMLGLVGHSWIYRMTEALAAGKGKAQDVLNLVAELLRDGKDLRQIVAELELHLRSLMIYQAAGTVEGLDLYAEPEDVLKKQATFWDGETIMQMLARLHETTQELRWSPQPRITVEIALLALCKGELGGVTRHEGLRRRRPLLSARSKNRTTRGAAGRKTGTVRRNRRACGQRAASSCSNRRPAGCQHLGRCKCYARCPPSSRRHTCAEPRDFRGRPAPLAESRPDVPRPEPHVDRRLSPASGVLRFLRRPLLSDLPDRYARPTHDAHLPHAGRASARRSFRPRDAARLHGSGRTATAARTANP